MNKPTTTFTISRKSYENHLGEEPKKGDGLFCWYHARFSRHVAKLLKVTSDTVTVESEVDCEKCLLDFFNTPDSFGGITI